MGSAEPGAELREEDIGADGQQQRLLLDEAIAASVGGGETYQSGCEICQCVRLVGKWFKGANV